MKVRNLFVELVDGKMCRPPLEEIPIHDRLNVAIERKKIVKIYHLVKDF